SIRPPGGLLQNRNFAGEFLGLAVPFALIAVRRRVSTLLVLLGLALALTRCRTGWIAAIAATGALIAVSKRSDRRIAAAGAGLLVVGALLAGILPNRLRWHGRHSQVKTLSTLFDVRSGSGAFRLRQYRETLALLDGRWVKGLGPGNWQRAISSRDPQLGANRIPHSDYLRTVSDGGIVALVGLLGVYAAAAALAWRRRSDFPEGASFVLALAIISMADAPLYRLETATLAFSFIACISRGVHETVNQLQRYAGAAPLTFAMSGARWEDPHAER